MRSERHQRIQPAPDADQQRSTASRTTAPKMTPAKMTEHEAFVFTEAVVRAGWSMRLHALLGEEVARAVDAEILTVAEAEVLLARMAVVIDQAVGSSGN
jgi:hypothetical protein